jgi:DNA-binding response OmpR family regulator
MAEQARKKILVIEDEEAVVRLLKTLLEAAGYEVHAVRCGTTALACASDSNPSLVILDLGLPDMDGYDVAKKLRQFFHPWSMPIVMLTGMDKPADQLRGFAHGADAYLTKPCNPEELLRTVALLLGQPDEELTGLG